jgi:MFS family permease
MFFHRRRHKKSFNNVIKFSIVSLIACFAFAQIDAILSMYIDSFVHNDALVGLIIAAFTIVCLAGFFILVPFFEKHRPDRLFLGSLIVYAIAYLLLALTKNFILFLIIGLIVTLTYVVRTSSSGVLLRDISKVKDIGKNESIIYSLINIAWLLGPLIAGFASDNYGMRSVFLLSTIFIIISIFAFLFSRVKDSHVTKKVHKNVFANLKSFFSNKDLMKAYVARGGVEVWWALIYIYMPLLILDQGKSFFWVGAFLFCNTIPLVALEYFFGKKVDKIGYKKFFIWGFGILLFCSFISFIVFDNFVLVLILLIIASIGLAILEPSTEAYFFKLVKKKDEDRYYGPFITSDDVGYLVGALVLAGVLALFSFKAMFLAVFIELIIIMLVVVRINKKH